MFNAHGGDMRETDGVPVEERVKGIRNTGRGTPIVYPIFIAVTALARLIVLQGKDMAPEKILFEAGAILLLSIAAVVIVRAPRI